MCNPCFGDPLPVPQGWPVGLVPAQSSPLPLGIWHCVREHRLVVLVLACQWAPPTNHLKKAFFFFGHCLLEMGGHVNMSHTLNFSRAGGAIPKVHRHAHETWLSSMCIYIQFCHTTMSFFFCCCCCCPDPRATCRKQQQYVCFMRFFPISKYPYYQVFGVKKKKKVHTLTEWQLGLPPLPATVAAAADPGITTV